MTPRPGQRQLPTLRPVRDDDAEAIWALLAPASHELVGMTSLPGSALEAETACRRSRETVTALATRSFSLDDGETRRLLLALDDGSGIVGLSGITFKRRYPNLGVRVATSADGLGLVMACQSELWTRTELDSSFLGTLARGRGFGSLLSRGRFLFLQLVAPQVPIVVASHLRGRFDQDGDAPFWRCFGARFAPWETSTKAEQALADDPTRLHDMVGQRLPMTAEVLDSMGPVNAASLPAFHVLMAEGLRPNGLYDPIDGGPTLVADIERTHSGRFRIHGRALIVDDVDPKLTVDDVDPKLTVDDVDRKGVAPAAPQPDRQATTACLIAAVGIDRFRATRASATIAPAPPDSGDETVIAIDGSTAEALTVTSGDLLVVLPLDASMPPVSSTSPRSPDQ